MMHHRKAPATSLEEDLAAIGVQGNADAIHGLATMTIEESIVGIGIKGHGGESLTEDADGDGGSGDGEISEDDPIDGKFVTRELLSRIVNLPFEQMEADDFDELLTSLKDKELPEDDEELHGLAKAVVEQLVEGKMQRIRKAMGGFMKKAKAGFHMVKGKIQKIKIGDRLRSARKRVRHMAGRGASVAKRWLAKKGKRFAARLAGRAPGPGQVKSDLAIELTALLGESMANDKYSDTMGRIASVFELLDEMMGQEAVAQVLESTFDEMKNQLTEDTDDEGFMEAVRPCLSAIKRCLEHIEKADKGEFELYVAEGGDDDDAGDGDGDGDAGERGNDPT